MSHHIYVIHAMKEICSRVNQLNDRLCLYHDVFEIVTLVLQSIHRTHGESKIEYVWYSYERQRRKTKETMHTKEQDQHGSYIIEHNGAWITAFKCCVYSQE